MAPQDTFISGSKVEKGEKGKDKSERGERKRNRPSLIHCTSHSIAHFKTGRLTKSHGEHTGDARGQAWFFTMVPFASLANFSQSSHHQTSSPTSPWSPLISYPFHQLWPLVAIRRVGVKEVFQQRRLLAGSLKFREFPINPPPFFTYFDLYEFKFEVYFFQFWLDWEIKG